MTHKKKAVFNWSGGKDSALALQKVLKNQEFEIVALLTLLNEDTLKSAVHSIPLEILSRQAKSIGIPLHTVSFARNLNNYSEKMTETAQHFKTLGVTHFIFGDLEISDAKNIREQLFNPLGIEIVEPLWHKTSTEVISEYLQSGIKSKIVVTQADQLDESFVGQELNEKLIKNLPQNVDPCGEKGEFHSLAYDGDLFKQPILYKLGETIKISYDINLANGETKTFNYWQAEISV
ncbi:diphthine--ammonia ligase [Tamlana sp. s12]|uniref:Dph6-related ATP pyrophosphatase n=1 Tax=Tamlana sp. s12 TaxID=1630406 RepID=UPI000801A726|nr:diphthine--ammonia ligase [Tamlana sp. s12]OBQ51921.1 ATP-binding domain-containing protein [Tamlana sp. s12]QQY83012.1 diphthine--ammonia ligase [Tamlana sp. s12]